MSEIAIIGTGISGLGAGALLHPHHAITVYEKNESIGGHTRTRNIVYNGRAIAVDTGFIVFNYRNYPNLAALFKHLGVPVQKSAMSFGVTAPGDDLEWGAESANALFGQRRNFLRPAFYLFLRDILKFNFYAPKAVRQYPHMTMGGLISYLKLGDWFARFYILPMGGAIWSLPLAAILAFPARTFVDFFAAHGLLSVTRQSQWYTVTGGGAEYLKRLVAPFRDRIKTACAAHSITRSDDKIHITDSQGGSRDYDKLILACHADEALALLADATAAEKEILGNFRYQKNIAVLHKHAAIMPKRRACWASWVYHADAVATDAPISVTYWMNHLQGIDPSCPLFVTLNPRIEIPAADIFESHEFTHPVYDEKAVNAQGRLGSLQGRGNTWFCGAYHRNGFHEDGLVSAINVAAGMGIGVPWA